MHATLGDESRSEVATKFVLEGEGHATEGWTVMPGVLRPKCTDFDDTFFNAIWKG